MTNFHQVETTALADGLYHHRCRVCGQERTVKAWAWVGACSQPQPRAEVRDTPCRHLGKKTGVLAKCGCHVPDWRKEVYECPIKGECVLTALHRPVPYVNCQRCDSYSSLVFRHIPKTGGGFVRHAIRELGLPARACGSHMRSMAGVGHQYFTAIRHPLTWYQSMWRYRMQSGWVGDFMPGDAAYVSDSFAEFVHKATPGYYSQICDGYIDADTIIIRQESLVEDLIGLFKDERIKGLPPTNVSSIECTHTPKTIEKIVGSEADFIAKYYPSIIASTFPASS